MLSGDEIRALSGIERHLADDDPLFAVRMAAGQRYIRFRAAMPFYRPLCVLLTAVAFGLVMALIGMIADGGDDRVPAPSTPSAPSAQIADDDRAPLIEPR